MNWFKHDINSLADDRLSSLVQEYGAEGYAVFYGIVEALYSNEGGCLDRLSLKRIAKDFGLSFQKVVEIADYAASDECGGLLHKDGDGYSSERVKRAIEENEEKVRQKKEAARERWDNYRRKVNEESMEMRRESNADAMQMHSKCNADAMQNRIDKIRGDEKRGDDICSSSPSQEEVLQATDKITESTIVSSVSPEPEGSDSTDEKRAMSVFIEIEALKGERVPVLEEEVERWQKAYPALSVKDEVLRAVAWLDANPSNRKSAKGMRRFLVNWLSRSQDRAARSGGRASDDCIKGTDVRMTARAIGSDPSRYDKSMTFDDIYDRYLEGRRQGGAG